VVTVDESPAADEFAPPKRAATFNFRQASLEPAAGPLISRTRSASNCSRQNTEVFGKDTMVFGRTLPLHFGCAPPTTVRCSN